MIRLLLLLAFPCHAQEGWGNAVQQQVWHYEASGKWAKIYNNQTNGKHSVFRLSSGQVVWLDEEPWGLAEKTVKDYHPVQVKQVNSDGSMVRLWYEIRDDSGRVTEAKWLGAEYGRAWYDSEIEGLRVLYKIDAYEDWRRNLYNEFYAYQLKFINGGANIYYQKKHAYGPNWEKLTKESRERWYDKLREQVPLTELANARAALYNAKHPASGANPYVSNEPDQKFDGYIPPEGKPIHIIVDKP